MWRTYIVEKEEKRPGSFFIFHFGQLFERNGGRNFQVSFFPSHNICPPHHCKGEVSPEWIAPFLLQGWERLLFCPLVLFYSKKWIIKYTIFSYFIILYLFHCYYIRLFYPSQSSFSSRSQAPLHQSHFLLRQSFLLIIFKHIFDIYPVFKFSSEHFLLYCCFLEDIILYSKNSFMQDEIWYYI